MDKRRGNHQITCAMAVDLRRGNRNMVTEMMVISCAKTDIGAVRTTDDSGRNIMPWAVFEYRGDDDGDDDGLPK